jgi:hypothetical protein
MWVVGAGIPDIPSAPGEVLPLPGFKPLAYRPFQAGRKGKDARRATYLKRNAIDGWEFSLFSGNKHLALSRRYFFH